MGFIHQRSHHCGGPILYGIHPFWLWFTMVYLQWVRATVIIHEQTWSLFVEWLVLLQESSIFQPDPIDATRCNLLFVDDSWMTMSVDDCWGCVISRNPRNFMVNHHLPQNLKAILGHVSRFLTFLWRCWPTEKINHQKQSPSGFKI